MPAEQVSIDLYAVRVDCAPVYILVAEFAAVQLERPSDVRTAQPHLVGGMNSTEVEIAGGVKLACIQAEGQTAFRETNCGSVSFLEQDGFLAVQLAGVEVQRVLCIDGFKVEVSGNPSTFYPYYKRMVVGHEVFATNE